MYFSGNDTEEPASSVDSLFRMVLEAGSLSRKKVCHGRHTIHSTTEHEIRVDRVEFCHESRRSSGFMAVDYLPIFCGSEDDPLVRRARRDAWYILAYIRS